MSDCTCPPRELVDPSCRVHGLYGDRKYPPMDRHAQWLPSEGRQETAAEVQRRLYLAAASDRVRVETAGFRWPLRVCPLREMGQR